MWNYLSGVKYKMENEKDLSDSEIESDLEEDIVFGKLFDFSRDWVFMCWQFWSWKCLIFCFENNKKVHYLFKFLCFIYLFSICNSHKLR